MLSWEEMKERAREMRSGAGLSLPSLGRMCLEDTIVTEKFLEIVYLKE